MRFGRQNILHLHDLPTSDPPLVNQAFLSPEALTDAGLSLSYVVPPKYTGNQYIEFIAEILSGEGASSESPTLGGDIDVDSPALNLHALWNHDLSNDLNLEIGGSWLTAKRSSDNGENVNLYAIDATLIHTDPTGRFNNQLLQAELFYGGIDQPDGGDTQHALGAYLLGQQQIHKDYYIGLRLDWTENPNDDGQETWAARRT